MVNIVAVTVITIVSFTTLCYAQPEEDLVVLDVGGRSVTVEAMTGVPYAKALQELSAVRWAPEGGLVMQWTRPGTTPYVPDADGSLAEYYHHNLMGAAEYYIRDRVLQKVIERYQNVVVSELGEDFGETYVNQYAAVQQRMSEFKKHMYESKQSEESFVREMNDAFKESDWGESAWRYIYQNTHENPASHVFITPTALPWMVEGRAAAWVRPLVLEPIIMPVVVDHEIKTNWRAHLVAARAEVGVWRFFIVKNMNADIEECLIQGLRELSTNDGDVALKGFQSFQDRLHRYDSNLKIEIAKLNLQAFRVTTGTREAPRVGVLYKTKHDKHKEIYDGIVTFQLNPDAGQHNVDDPSSEFVRYYVHRAILMPLFEEVMREIQVVADVKIRSKQEIIEYFGRGSIHEAPVGIRLRGQRDE